MFAAFTFVTLHMDFLITVLRFIWFLFLALMVFNLMIVVHEWGHFLAGRWRGLKIDRFQIRIGIDPRWWICFAATNGADGIDRRRG